MKHTFHIHGMTCSGCRNHVEQTLSNVEGVSDARVDLEKGEATIEMEKHIPIEKFQEVLKNFGGRYTIHNMVEHHYHSESKTTKKSNSKGTDSFYCPMHCEGDETYAKS